MQLPLVRVSEGILNIEAVVEEEYQAAHSHLQAPLPLTSPFEDRFKERGHRERMEKEEREEWSGEESMPPDTEYTGSHDGDSIDSLS